VKVRLIRNHEFAADAPLVKETERENIAPIFSQEDTHEVFQNHAAGMRIAVRERHCCGAEHAGQARFGHDSGLVV
jgi:hypothetical protein